MSGTCNIRGIIFACRQHKHFGDLRSREECCSEYLSSKLDCCLGPRLWTEDPSCPTHHTWVFCVFHTELIDNFLFYHTQTWVEAMV